MDSGWHELPLPNEEAPRALNYRPKDWRDELAIDVMKELLTLSSFRLDTPEQRDRIAHVAYAMADSMMRAR